MKAMAAKQPSNDFHRQHQEVIQAPVLQNEIPSTDAIVLQRMSACPCDGGCPLCEGGMVIQPKLKIGEPGDRYEREADRVADEVMRMPDPQSVTQSANEPSILRMYPMCEEEEEELLQSKTISKLNTQLAQRQTEDKGEMEEFLQNNKTIGHNTTITPDFESQINTIKGGGHPLPESIRAFFEPRFKYDFSNVRIHKDNQAAKSAQAINARAFTKGRHIVFADRQYAPGTLSGRQLIAHELTHFIQQRNAQNSFNGSMIQLTCADRCRRIHRPGDPDDCSQRECLGCREPPRGMPPQATRSNRRLFSDPIWDPVIIYYCPDSTRWLDGQDAELGRLNRNIRYHASREGHEVRIFGYSSPDFQIPEFRNDYLAAQRAWHMRERCISYYPNGRGRINAYIEGNGIPNQWQILEDCRQAYIEFVQPNRRTRSTSPPPCTTWALELVGEAQQYTILGLQAGNVYLEMLTGRMVNRESSNERDDRTFESYIYRYVGLGVGLGLDFEDLIIGLIGIIFNVVPNIIKDLLRPIIGDPQEEVSDFAIGNIRRAIGVQEWDCKILCTPQRIVWDDWAHGGSRITGPLFTFMGTGSKLGTYTTFDLSGYELPTEFRASRGIHSILGLATIHSIHTLLTRINPHLAYVNILQINPIINFLFVLEDWLNGQNHDWKLLNDSLSTLNQFPNVECDVVPLGNTPTLFPID
jgi:hypothetical protein